jgi:hypothetical protein
MNAAEKVAALNGAREQYSSVGMEGMRARAK